MLIMRWRRSALEMGTKPAVATIIRIGDARVDFATLSIEGQAGRVTVEPKVMDLLQVLVEHAGTVVSRADLLDRVWSETIGSDESLSRAISLLRRAFGETRGGRKYIETVPKRGYRLVAEVVTEDGDSPDQAVTPEGSEDDAGRAAPGGGPAAPGPRTWRRLVVPGVLLMVVILLFWLVGRQGLTPGENGPIQADAPAIAEIEPRQKSIAVLPFEDLSSEGDQQYLADGLAEEILNALVRFSDLRVIGRTSSFNFRDPEPDLGQITSALAVSHILTGSVRKQGGKVRVTARLIDTSEGLTVWSERYDGNLTDIFDLQDKIARQISSNLGLILDLALTERFAPQLTDDRRAYDLFLQGRALARKFGHRNKLNAKALLEQAVALDPNFAAAWAWLGQANLYLTLTAQNNQIADLVNTARYAVNRSLTLDPDLAMGHYVKTVLLDYDLDFAGSIDAVEKAYELNPSQPFLAVRRGYYRAVIGRSREGARMMEQGLRWDPTDSVGLLNLGMAKQALGQLDQAAVLLQRSDDLGFQPAGGQLCNVLHQKKEFAEANRCWQARPESFRHRYSPLFQTPEQWQMLGKALFLDDPVAREEAAGMLDAYFSQDEVRSNSYLLQLLLVLGGPQRYMSAFLNHPYPLNAGGLTSIWEEREAYRSVRQHPDFPSFAQRIGLIEAWEKYGWPDSCEKLDSPPESIPRFSCH